jgi:hypothetical protein
VVTDSRWAVVALVCLLGLGACGDADVSTASLSSGSVVTSAASVSTAAPETSSAPATVAPSTTGSTSTSAVTTTSPVATGPTTTEPPWGWSPYDTDHRAVAVVSDGFVNLNEAYCRPYSDVSYPAPEGWTVEAVDDDPEALAVFVSAAGVRVFVDYPDALLPPGNAELLEPIETLGEDGLSAVLTEPNRVRTGYAFLGTPSESTYACGVWFWSRDLTAGELVEFYRSLDPQWDAP